MARSGATLISISNLRRVRHVAGENRNADHSGQSVHKERIDLQRHFMPAPSVVDTVEPQITITQIGADLSIVGQQSGRPLLLPHGRFDLASILKKCTKFWCAATATRIDGQGALIGRLSFRRPIQSP